MLEKTQLSLRLQMLESLSDPLVMLPRGMAPSISRAGIDPEQEARARVQQEIRKIQDKLED